MTDSVIDFKAHIREHLAVAESLLSQVDLMTKMAHQIVGCLEKGGKVLILGNGGSAADAQHIAAELVGRFKRDRKPLAALALTTDSSILTAVANDVGYENSFARQVEALVRSDDVVWALSVSGRSPNVLRAMELAKSLGAYRLGFTGRLTNKLSDLCDVCLHVDHEESDRVQEGHQLAYHLICDQVERHFFR